MQLTKNFHAREFKSRDGMEVPANLLCNLQAVAEQLQILRDHLKAPIHLNSGFRSPAHNKAVGGAANSQHLLAKAADITTRDKTPKQLAAVIEKLIKDGKMKNGGVGIYKGFVHYDIGSPRRWNG